MTLKDGSGWIVDPAGAQHGQDKPVLCVFHYNAMFIDKVLTNRPYGESQLYNERFVIERHPQNLLNLVACRLGENLGHVEDEFCEWQIQHGSIEGIIKANTSNYQLRKSMLVTHLATTAREFRKYAKGDPTSTAKPINLNDKSANLSEEDKQRMERKRAREMAAMDPSVREMVEREKAIGTEVVLL